MKKRYHMIFFIVFICILITLILNSGSIMNVNAAKENESIAFVKDMKLGWNLGNTLDCIDGKRQHSVEVYETLWGNPITTKEMIQMVADAGFGTVRIPVTYYDNCNIDAIIDEAWLDRVEEIVNYVLDTGMYCVINVHHDTGKGAWINSDTAGYEENSKRLEKLWKQIAERFQSYDERLIFEGFNELLNSKNQWTGASSDDYENTNKLNQLFVDTVRNTGGKNQDRYLITNLYAAIPSIEGVQQFKLPSDSVPNRIIVGFHCYENEDNKISEVFSLIKENFVDKGIPVVLSEFGMAASDQEDITQKRLSYTSKIVSKAANLGIVCFWWDDGGKFSSIEQVNNFALLDRYNKKWYFPDIIYTMLQALQQTEDSSIQRVKALMFSGGKKSLKTDIHLGINSEYELIISASNPNCYGNFMLTSLGNQTCYRVRQELGDLYVAYGWNNFFTIKLEKNKMHVIEQKENSTYIDGTLVKKTVQQDFPDGVLQLGDTEMNFYGMTITENGEVVHELVPVIDQFGKACVQDELTGILYYPEVEVPYIPLEENPELPEEKPTIGEEESTEGEPTIPDKEEGRRVKAVLLSSGNKSIKTDICLGIETEYELIVSASNINHYGNFMIASVENQICYRVRQELGELYVAYGWNNFSTVNLEKDKQYIITQQGNNTYIDGKLVRTCVQQNFSNGNMKFGETEMGFYGMKITENGNIIHQLVPFLDASGKACIKDEVTGKQYYPESDISYIE